MKLLITILILSGILLGCKKNSEESEYYIIKGLVLDYDSKQPIAGAKVYQYEFCCKPEGPKDSMISDANGMVTFTCRNEGDYKVLLPTKDNYLHPFKYMNYQVLDHIGRTDTIYLARPSYLQLTVHRSNSYQPSDSIFLRVGEVYYSPLSLPGPVTLLKDTVSSVDKNFTLYTFYELPDKDRVALEYFVTRNGTLLANQSISVNLIQFGTQNFILNY